MPRDEVVLLDVYRAGRHALAFVEGVPDAEAFGRDLKTRSAVLHQLLVLGEAVKRLSSAFRDAHPGVPWRQMAGLRDVLIHAYDIVDEVAVWHVLQRELPDVLTRIAPLLPPAEEAI